MNLPKSINPCPIIEAVLEVRFEPLVPKSAAFGIIYNQVKNNFKTAPVSLPILQLPEQLRERDENLKFKPHYKISKENIVLQIGPDVLSISMVKNYMGWDVFSNEIYDLLDQIEKSKIVKEYSRIGIRYVNFFESQIYDNINVGINLNGNNIDYSNTVVRTRFTHEVFRSNLLITNEAGFNNKKGSIIDIDTFLDDKNLMNNKSLIKKIIREGHLEEKKLFYKLLKKEFLEGLNPKY